MSRPFNSTGSLMGNRFGQAAILGEYMAQLADYLEIFDETGKHRARGQPCDGANIAKAPALGPGDSGHSSRYWSDAARAPFTFANVIILASLRSCAAWQQLGILFDRYS
ncbi:MAG: hypothetical protein MR428_05170 [Mesosutterella sp.]|nr:hypothetical protein [Mesosutterella sp.]